MTTINFNNMPLLHVPKVEDITKKMPTSFEDFVQQEQKRIQQENALKGRNNVNMDIEPNASVGTNDKHTMLSANAGSIANNKKKKSTLNKKVLNKHAKARNAIAEAVALTSSRAVAVENGSHSVLPGNANATDDEIDAIMKKQKDLPVGNTKEERKKRRLVRNRVSAQLHRERKKKYIAALETKVKEQNEQLLHLGRIIQTMNVEYQRLQNAANKNLCPSCVSSGSDSSIPFSSSSSDTSSSCHSSPLTGAENDDLDEEDFDDDDKEGEKEVEQTSNTASSNVHWVRTTAPTTVSKVESMLKSKKQKITAATASTSFASNKRAVMKAGKNKNASLLDDNTEALTNSSDEDLQMYADKLLSPVNLCDDDDVSANDHTMGNDNIVNNSNNLSTLQRESAFDTSFIFNDVDGLDTNIDELMNSPTNADIADAFGITLSDVEDDGSDDEDDLPIFNCNSNKKSKKRKRSHNKNTAMLFGMFFMLAFFGSYIGGVVPSSKTLIQLPSSTSSMSTTSLPLLSNHGDISSDALVSTAGNSRRRRRLLSADLVGNKSGVVSNNDLNNVNTDDKAIALWQNILHDMKSSPPVKYPVVGNSDVKQLLLKIGNFSHSYKSSKTKRINGNSGTAQIVNRKQALRARSSRSAATTAMSTNGSHTLVPYHKNMEGAMDVDTVFTQNIMNTNASFMLCPKPYGTLAHTDPKPAAPSATYENGNFEHVPNTFMYDDVKVNRELVLLMPSTSLGGKMGLGTNQQWDGQWVQVDAIVKRIQPAAGLSGIKAIAGSQ